MRAWIPPAFLWSAALLLLAGLPIDESFAQSQISPDQNALPARSVQQEESPSPSRRFKLQDFAVRPQAGAINFKGNSRLSTGIIADFRFFQGPWVALGFEAGGLFSGLNNPINGGSGFSSGLSGQNHTYIIQVPTELQLSFLPDRSDTRWKFGPSVGINTIYSSSGVGNAFGTNSDFVTPDLGQGARWNPHFSFGPELTYAPTSALELGLRFDNTIMSAFSMRTLTFSLGFKA